MAEESNTLKLYNSLRDNGYKLPEYDRFEGRLKDSAARETLYNTLRDNGVNDLPEFSAFETWLGYPMPEDLKQQQSTNQEDKSKDSFFDDLGDRFMSGTNRTLGSVANLLDKGTKVLENTFGIERSGTFGEAAESFNRRADEYRKESNRYNGKDFVQLAKEGDWGGALGEIFLSATESAPQSLGIIASGGTGLTAAGLMAANDKYDQLIKDNPDMNRGAALVNSAVTGLSEYLTECLGAGAIGKLVRRSFALGGKEAAGKAISDYLTSRSADFMAKHGIIGPVATEAMEEMINAATEYGTDLITGVQRDDSFGEAVAKAGVYGAAGGAQFTPMTVAANYVARRRLQNASAEETPSQSATQNQEQMREDAIQRGKEMPETEYNSAYQSSEQSRQPLSDIYPNLAATIDRYVNDESSATEVQSLFDGLDETVRPLAEAYYQTQLVMRGITERNLDDAEAEVQAFADRIAPFAVPQDDGRRLITTAHFSEGLTEKDVYVSAINGDKAVIFTDDGSTRMVSAKCLQNIQEQDADDLIARYKEGVLNSKNSQMEFRLHHHPKTQPAQPGLVIFNGDKAYILQERDERGDWVAFPAVLDTETGQTTAKKGGEPSILTDAEVLELQDLMYAAQEPGNQANEEAEKTSGVLSETPNVSDETLGENPAGSVSPEERLTALTESLPKTKDGAIDYKRLTPQQQYEYTSLTDSPEVALEDIRRNIAAGNREIDALDRQLEKATGGKLTEIRDKMRAKREEVKGLKELYREVAPSPSLEEGQAADVNGYPFATNPDGDIDFGSISSETGLAEAPIRLVDGTELYGKEHIERNHGEQIRNAGFDSVEDFVSYVASNYDTIREGNNYDGKKTYLVELTDRKNNTLFVELSSDGSYWNVNSAGVFRKGYSKKKDIVWTAPAVGHNSTTENKGVANSITGDKGSTGSTSGDSPQTISSEGKGTQPAEENQAISEENARPSADDMLDTLLDGSLSIEEVDAFVDANRKDVGKRLADIDKKKPVPGTNLAEYKRKRSEWQSRRDAVQQEADYWEDINNRLQESRRQPGDDAALNVLKNQTPQTGEELAAEMLADGSIKLLRDDYMRETGGGRGETRGLFGLFAGRDKGGMTIEQAGEVLMQADLEQGTNLFDQSDPNAGRNAIIEVLSEARTRGDLINYVRRSREEQARRAAEAEYNEYAEWCEANFRMSPEDYEAYVEAMERDFRAKMQTPEAFDQVSGEIYDEMLAQQQEYADIDAILEQSNEIENEDTERNDEGRGSSLREGGGEILPGTQPVEAGGTGDVEGIRQAGSDVDSADGVAQAEGGRIEPVGTGPFGFIYNQFKGKVREAIDFLTRHQSGDLLGVFHRDDVGDIDLVWGDKNGGLAHIIDKHITTHDDFKDIDEASQVIEDVINNGEITKDGKLRIEITDGKYKVSIRKDYNGESKNWVVTALDASRGEQEKRIPAIKTSSTDNNQEGVSNTLGISSDNKDTGISSQNQVSAPEFIPGESFFDMAERQKAANDRRAEEQKVDTNPADSKQEDAVRTLPAVGSSTSADATEVNNGTIEGATVTSGDSSQTTSSENKGTNLSEGEQGELQETPKSTNSRTDVDSNQSGKSDDTATRQNLSASSEGKGRTSSSQNKTSTANKMQSNELPLSESEYADVRSKELLAENPQLGEEEAYNMALDEFPSYIQAKIESGELEDLYARLPVGGQIKLSDIIEAAGYSTSDISGKANRQRRESKGSNVHSIGEKISIRFYDGTTVRGDIVKAENGKVTVLSDANGRRYTVPEKNIIGEQDNIRFRFIGERGASNLDRAEEATTRMDNLNVARDMENANNEKKARIEKLRASEPVEITGEEYKGKYELKRDSAKAWIKDNLRGEYTINDTNETVAIGRKGINKVTSHSMGNEAHLKSLIAVPDIIQNAIFITEEVAEKKNAQYPKYRYYVVGLKIGGEDYTVKVTIGVDENGNKYYDHALTEIEKGTLIDNLNGTNPVADNQNANGFISTGAEPDPSVTGSKDTKLRTILQTSPQKNARKIKMATGWERGADGKWRYETPDIELTLPENIEEDKDYKLTDFVKDDELFKAYPHMKDYKVRFENQPDEYGSGGYGSGMIVINTAHSYPEHYESIFVHEIQHGIQAHEGFESGDNPDEVIDRYLDAQSDIETADVGTLNAAAFIRKKAERLVKKGQYKYMRWAVRSAMGTMKGRNRMYEAYGPIETLALYHTSKELHEAYERAYNEGGSLFNSGLPTVKEAERLYKRNAGEVEARNVQTRMNMPEELRRSSLASDTEDISREDQLFIDNALNNSYERRTGNTAPQIPRPEANRANLGIGPFEYPNDDLGRPEHAEPRGGQDARGREADGRPQPGTGRDDSQNGTDNGRRITDARREDRRAGGRNHAAAGRAGEQPRREDRRGGQRSTSNDTEPEGDNRVAGANNRRPSSDNRGFGGTTGERRERVRRAAVEAGERLGVKVHILHSPGEVTNRAARREIANGNRVAGWYDIPSRRVYIYLPDIANESEAIKTVLHEAVGHKGLRQLLGLDKQEYDAAMMRLYGQLPLSVRQKVEDKAMLDYGGDFAVAMDEYLADQAERDETPSWWNRVKSAVRDMLRSLGLNVELSDNDVKYLLWRSRKVLSNNNPFEVAEDLQMRRKLGIDDSTVRFRTAKEEVEQSAPSGESMVKAWDRLMSSDWFKMKEALYDYLLSVEKFQKLVAQKTKSKILDFENAYWSLLAVSSRNKDEFDRLESKFIPELNNAIRSLVGQVKGKWDWSKGPLRDLVMYVEAKHGIERNRDLAVRKGIESLAKEPLSRFVKAGIVSEQEVDAFRKEAERKAKERAEKKASESQKKLVEQATLEKEERDFKHNCMKQLYKKWEDAKHDLFQQQIPWEEKQARLDEAAREFQWKDDGGNFGAVFGNDYSGLSSVFKPEGEDSNARNTEWDRLAHEYVKKYEQEHEASAIDNLWTSIKNLSEYSLRKQNETGLINKEYLQNNLGRFEYFIPLRGFEDTTAGEVYDYIYNNEIRAGSPVKAMEGRSSEAANPFGGLLSVAYSSITSGNKNLAKQKFLNLIRNHDTEGLATVSDVWIRNVGTKEEEDWVEVAPEIKENASPDEVAQAMNDFEEKMKALQEEGLALKTKGGHSDIPYRTLGGQRNEHQVQVLVGGNRYIITINGNPRVAQALNGLTNPDVDESGMWAYGKKVQQFMAGAFTSYNPAFSLANLSRDTGYSSNMVFINEDVKYWKEFLKNQKAGFFELPKMASFLRAYREGNIDNLKGNDAKLFKEFMMNGGATGYTFIENQKEYAEKLVEQMKELSKGNLSNMSPRKWLKLMFDSFEFMGNAAELVNRFAVYKTSRSVGRSIARSINDAKEVTINFSRKGAGRKTYDPKNKWYVNLAAAISQFGRQYILFWNASLQGKVKLFKSAMNHPVKALPSFVGGAAGIGMMLPFLNNMFLPMLYQMFGVGGDDDDKEDYYDVLSDYDREKNICLRLPGGGYWLKIPVSPDMSIFMGLGDKIAGNILGKREIDITDGVKAMADVTSPIGLNWNYEGTAFALNAFPTVVQPVMQTMMNVNFMGSPIKKESINRAKAFDPEYTKVYRSASSSLVELSKLSNNLSGGDAVKAGMIDWNPAVLQNFINGYTGGFGSVLIGMADMVVDASKGEKAEVAVSRYPLVSRFLSGGDIEVKKRRVNANYQSKVVDFVNETEHRYKGYERMIADPKITDFDRAEYMVKYNELTNTKDFKKYFELKSYIDAIKEYEKWLKDFGANDDIENQLYELKLRALEILDKKE